MSNYEDENENEGTQLFLTVMRADTGAHTIVEDHLEAVDLQDWNQTVALVGEIEDIVYVLNATDTD